MRALKDASRLLWSARDTLGSTLHAQSSGIWPVALPTSALLRGYQSVARKRVAVALSGGVDSALAALLLRNQGHEVFGVFMRNWDEAEEQGNAGCSAEADLRDAEAVAKHLGIPLHTADFVAGYWNRVFTDFLDKCSRGLTPNPDLPCNRHIKFDALLSFAASLGADSIATGHYARLRRQPDGKVQLLRGLDRNKDQSYFLASVRPGAFERVLFPLGAFTKVQVRAMAADAGLPVSHRRSSAGICFIGRRKFGDFLAEYAAPMPGAFVEVGSGRRLGDCPNMAAVTYGQRASLGGSPERMYVAGKDIPGRKVFLAQGSEHPALFTHSALLSEFRWLSGEPPAELEKTGSFRCSYMARYRQQPQQCTLGLGGVQTSAYTVLMPEDHREIGRESIAAHFPAAAKAITPQQEFVVYDGEVCLGSAPVVSPGRTLAEAEHLSVTDGGHEALL